ncbi:hypothetical protein E4T56_gene11966 [Termitomyces sp. T112]|nr:hypothetical protein E4T56_gene11966 [Termitomyces sp. T112]
MRTTLQIAAIGSSGENKTILINSLNSYTYRRKYDKVEFHFSAKDCSDANDSLWKKYQYIIVIYDYDDMNGRVEAHRIISNLCTTFCEPQLRICFVITNQRHDLSDLDFTTRFRIRHSVYVYNVQTVSVCHATGEGVDELARYIADSVHPQTVSIRTWSFDTMWGCILDFLSKQFALPLPKDTNKDTADLLELDDSDVYSLVRSPLAKQWDLSLQPLVGPLGSITAHRITPTLLAKYSSSSEIATMSFLRKHTTIPIPQPRYPHLQAWMVMDFIEGKMLYHSQLRRLRGDIPGRLGDGLVSGIQFEEVGLGSFKSATHFRRYCELIAQFSWNQAVEYRKPTKPLPAPLVFGDDWDLVFTHADLNLTNIILSDDGVLWVIDWGNSGFYPKCMESITMQRHDDINPKSWKNLRWFVSGSFPVYEVFWEYLEHTVQRFRRGL